MCTTACTYDVWVIQIQIHVCFGTLSRGRLPTLSQAGFASASPFGITSAHRGTGVAIVLLTHPRALRSHARGLTGLSVWRVVGPASLGGLENEYGVRRRRALGFVVVVVPCCHHLCSRPSSVLLPHCFPRTCHRSHIPPSRHSYRPRTTRSTVTAPTSNPRFSPPALARSPFSTYPVLFLIRRALRRRVSSYPRVGPSVKLLFPLC